MQSKSKTRSPNGVLIMTTISHMMQHIFVGTSVLFPLIIADLRLSYTEFGFAIALSTIIGGLSQIFFSAASRKIARHVLMGCGNVLLSAGTFLTGISQRLIDFTGWRTLSNIGIGPQHPMGTAIISERFDRKSLGKAIGIHYGLAYVGNIVGPLFMTFLAVAAGWRNTLFVFAIPAFIVGLTVIWYLTESSKTMVAAKEERISDLKSDMVALAKTGSFIPLIFTQVFLSGGTDLGIITTYTPLFLANELNLDATTRGLVYTVGLAGGVLGPIFLGRYADRSGWGQLKIATISCFSSLILVYLLTLHNSANALVLLSVHLFFLGLTSFSLPTLIQSHLISITERYRRDLAIGIYFTVSFVFSSVWTGIMGYIIDSYASFKPAFLLMGTLGLVALVILVQQARKYR